MENKFRKRFFQNASIAFILQIVNLFTTFVVRTIFVKQLGNEYLSLNGLLVNVVSLLSFAELGIGNAIIFSLYEPIATQNYEKINSLMQIFKKAYRWIRIAIIVLGLLITPFINSLVNGVSVSEDFKLLFWLFIANTYVSYFFAYKKSLLIADQKNYIVALIQQIILIVQSICQCLIIIVLKNFLLYLIFQIIGTMLINIVTSVYVDNHYKYLKNDTFELSKHEVKSIFDNIKNIFCYKVGAVILNSIDNILISSLIATKLVGLYSNYSMIINALNSVLMQVCNSIAATIGNYNVVNSDEENEGTFRTLFFLSFWVFGICTICLIELLNPFIHIWLGDKYLLDFSTVVIISLVFYITGINQIPSQYRTSFGIFKQAKLVPIIAAIINIVLSIVLGKLVGLNGIFLATIFAKVLTFNIVDPYLIYKNGFHNNCIKFMFVKLQCFTVLVVAFLGIHFINSFIIINSFIGFVCKAVATFLLTNLLFAVLLLRYCEFKKILEGLNHGKA